MNNVSHGRETWVVGCMLPFFFLMWFASELSLAKPDIWAQNASASKRVFFQLFANFF